jgi:branched-subunit amino acid aminotransferase/4-amino-4-deoxychorismate lyase
LKTTSYAENVRALEAAHTVGFSEAIFLDTKDRLSEGTGTNLFFVSNNVVYTPSVACGILEGITRELVMELCSITSIAVVEGEFSTSDLIAADEVFITSSTRDVHPVTRIALLNDLLDIYTEYSFEVGPVTAQLRDAWVQQFSKNLNP